MVIFKRVTMPREKIPNGLAFICNTKGWMNEDVMKEWTERCFRTQQAGILDSASGGESDYTESEDYADELDDATFVDAYFGESS
ncbi:hypothetical protein Y1Q_0006913 [Alligator mississippiensis]|uniref:DDE-1 domain-containing protein n=1 Tax=Alligator mississippiensis TaxID=8496 RepID=A0A151MUK4_ALLMI|nr:hypothetical protein Y1Q_0006913 [Alligator mississippiensis]